jgi:histidinol-phosphatase (PHP family)
VLPADNHIHSQWSYDTGEQASMSAACQRALDAGVPAVAFTEHLDFNVWGAGDSKPSARVEPGWWKEIRPLDVTGYLASVADCRRRYPSLRILSGVEAGEPHLFAGSAGAVIASTTFDRVLGSLHAVPHEGRLVSVGSLFRVLPAEEVMHRYFAEALRMVESSDLFEVIAHFDYPRRFWPRAAGEFAESSYEEEYRALMRALARSGRVLEVNTNSPLASVSLVRWWREEGGGAVSFGSDAHVPWRVGDRFDLAVDVVEAAGFRSGRDMFDFWRR